MSTLLRIYSTTSLQLEALMSKSQGAGEERKEPRVPREPREEREERGRRREERDRSRER